MQRSLIERPFCFFIRAEAARVLRPDWAKATHPAIAPAVAVLLSEFRRAADSVAAVFHPDADQAPDQQAGSYPDPDQEFAVDHPKRFSLRKIQSVSGLPIVRSLFFEHDRNIGICGKTYLVAFDLRYECC